MSRIAFNGFYLMKRRKVLQKKIERSRLNLVRLNSIILQVKGRNNMFDMMFFDEWEQAFSVLEGLEENELNKKTIVEILESYEYFIQAEHIDRMNETEFQDFVQANLMYY